VDDELQGLCFSRAGLALAGTPVRGTNFINDGHYSDYPWFDAGIEAEYLLRRNIA
jgi:hypothetical protein